MDSHSSETQDFHATRRHFMMAALSAQQHQLALLNGAWVLVTLHDDPVAVRHSLHVAGLASTREKEAARAATQQHEGAVLELRLVSATHAHQEKQGHWKKICAVSLWGGGRKGCL